MFPKDVNKLLTHQYIKEMKNTKIYWVKLNANHTARPDQMRNGYLYNEASGHDYTRYEAIKKARMFNGVIEPKESEQQSSKVVMYNSKAGSKKFPKESIHKFIDVDSAEISALFLAKIQDKCTYKDMILKEHIYSVDHLKEELQMAGTVLTLEEAAWLTDIEIRLGVQDCGYFRLVFNP